ncbi:hypothetical protein, partial [Aeromonas caviae]|uniref:hypothetical protein n=1 Tax=Aeromonas caviae TaxID=648 RepID=UPI001C8AEEFD
RLDTYRCRDAKSGAARETRAGAKRGCLKQLCATTILKNADPENSYLEIGQLVRWKLQSHVGCYLQHLSPTLTTACSSLSHYPLYIL